MIDGRPSIDPRTPLEVVVIERSPGGSRATVEMIHTSLPPSRVRVVGDLAGALDLLSRGPVDTVVVDLSPPARPDIAVVEALVSAHPETAVVTLTSTTNSGFGLETLAAGGEDHLVSSSLDPASLARALLNAVQRKAAKPHAFTGREVVRSLLETISDASCAVQSDGEIVAVNSAWRAFMSANGGREETCAEGSNYLAACEASVVRGPRATTQSEVARGLSDVLAGRVSRYEHEYPCHSAMEDRWFTVQMASTEIEGRPGAIITQLNVTMTHDLRQSLALQALHDPVTGLPNRLLLVDRLSQALLDGDSRGTGIMVACLDIDNFKNVNLGLGRARGDELLVELAQRISSIVLPKDTVSRVSADQFVIVRGDIQAASEVAGLCQQLVSNLALPLAVGSTPLVVTACIGAVVGRLPQTAEDLLDAADAALVDAKRAGIGRVRLFTDDLLDDDLRERTTTPAGSGAAAPAPLHGPTTNVVLYEPVVSLAGGQVVSVEAMVGLQSRDPGRDQGSSSALPMKAGDVHRELAWWALETACRDLAAQTGLVRGVDLEVNLPSGSLGSSDVVSRVSDAVARAGLDPRRLVLQISESAMVAYGREAIGNLDGLSAQGIRIALNGFGIGDTRLPQLGRYPIGFLKLDPVFVAGIGVRPDEEAYCSSVISLADALGAGSVAEGVTTAAQHTVLHGFGCHQAQGPLWSRAVPIDDLAAAIFRCRAIAVPVPTRRRRSETQRRPEVTARIAKMQEVGASLPTVAAALNRDGTVNPTGMRWLPSDVARLIAD